MKFLLKYLKSDNWGHWIKIIAKFMSVQMGIKLLGMVISVYLIRILAKEDYAYFTIAISIMSTIVLLSDSGIGSGFMAIGGRHWDNKERMGKLVNGALLLRKKQFWAAASFAFPTMFWLLYKNDAPLMTIFFLMGIVGLGASFEIRTIIHTATLRLNNQYDSVQKIDIINTLIRLVLIVSVSFIFLDGFVAVVVSVFAYGINLLVARTWANPFSEPSKEFYKEDKKEILSIVKHQLPNAIYYAIIGQVTVFLISIFGSTENIAEVGVLSRLAIIFSIISITLTTVVMPIFSKSKDPKQILKLFSILMFLVTALAVTMIGFAMAFPDFFLYIFGNKYTHLTEEVVWLVASSMLSLLVGIIFKINSSRGWVIKWYIFIPIGILTQVVALFTLNVATVLGVIQYQLVLNLPALFVFLHLFFQKVNELKKEQKQEIELSSNNEMSKPLTIH